jgi:hypothetical protein
LETFIDKVIFSSVFRYRHHYIPRVERFSPTSLLYIRLVESFVQ